MSEAAEEIQRLTGEVERLETVDKDREKYFALMKEKGAEIEQHFDVMASERNRFNASINRLAEIVGLSGKQCFAPEAVERQAKFELATLRGRVEDLEGKRFPIQGGPSIPWRMILSHEGQLQKNHGQTLERMAERGGLSPSEALCVLDGEGWRGSRWGDFTCAGRGDHPKEKAAHDELERRRAAFEDETNALRDWKESMLKVEATWDPQEVARELGLKLNEDIRPNILPKIQALREELEFLKPLKLEFEKAKNLFPPPDTKLAVCSGLHDHIKAIADVILPDGPRGEYKTMVAEVIRRWNDAQPALNHMYAIVKHVGGAEILGHIENLEEEVQSIESENEDLAGEIKRLKKAAVDCDFHVLQCPVLKGEDLDLLDAKEVCPEEEADWQDGNKEVYGPGSVPGADPSREVVLLDQGEPVVAVRKGTDFGCDDHDARPHSRCYVCDGSGTVPGAFLSHVRQPCETCGGTGNELGPPFPMCHKMPECPNKECPHFKLEDNRCGRKTEDHIVRNPPLNLGPVDEKENGEEVQD